MSIRTNTGRTREPQNEKTKALWLADRLSYEKAAGCGTVRGVQYWTARAQAMLDTTTVSDFRTIAKLIEAIEEPARLM